ncbi:MAG: hypothetical protein E7Z76_00515 [Methanobrevibacter sp.]|nr:hypothetical protein [Methanobrevibacter sp.]
MANIKMFKLLGVLLALMLVIWAILPILRHQALNNELIATAIILIMIAAAYLVILFNPSWTKAVFFFEGIVIGVSGYILLTHPFNAIFLVIGLFIVMIAILAYIQKLPAGVLKWFYR